MDEQMSDVFYEFYFYLLIIYMQIDRQLSKCLGRILIGHQSIFVILISFLIDWRLDSLSLFQIQILFDQSINNNLLIYWGKFEGYSSALFQPVIFYLISAFKALDFYFRYFISIIDTTYQRLSRFFHISIPASLCYFKNRFYFCLYCINSIYNVFNYLFFNIFLALLCLLFYFTLFFYVYQNLIFSY
ncbi:hypothetical protein ABPG74_004304 [Tetrahymena malaccensis]